MAEVKLGTILEGGEQRDAVHIAIAPVIAAERLTPGQDVGFMNDDGETVGTSTVKPRIGIIDPFLKMPVVEPGQGVWLFLFPNTITSLRHEWTHSAFAPKRVRNPEDDNESVQWIRKFADEIGLPYETVMEAGKCYSTGGGYTNVGDRDGYTDVGEYRTREFWLHYASVTGYVNDETFLPFRCAC